MNVFQSTSGPVRPTSSPVGFSILEVVKLQRIFDPFPPKIVVGLLWLLLWPFQFTTSLRWKSPRVHRWVGTFLLLDAAAVLFGVIPMCTMGGCLYVHIAAHFRIVHISNDPTAITSNPGHGPWLSKGSGRLPFCPFSGYTAPRRCCEAI